MKSDVQFGVTRTLIGNYVCHDEPHPNGAGTPWYSLEHLLVMEAGEAILPRPPIK